jgi:hypothetical protein
MPCAVDPLPSVMGEIGKRARIGPLWKPAHGNRLHPAGETCQCRYSSWTVIGLGIRRLIRMAVIHRREPSGRIAISRFTPEVVALLRNWAGKRTATAIAPFHQEFRTQARAEEALVPKWPEMADRMRGTHKRCQAPTWTQLLPVQGRRQNAALGGVIADNVVNIGCAIKRKSGP